MEEEGGRAFVSREPSNGRGMKRRAPELTTPVGAANQKPRRRFRFGRLLRKAQESAKEGR